MQLRHTKHLLWLFAAALLLMQSIAVWHDAEHAFHDHIALCDQLNVVSHTPSTDNHNQLTIAVRQQYFQLEASVTLPARFDNFYLSITIRAPPIFS
ncbi:hypothetical protein Q7A_1158 [Methylophaga nitratireducenticrescens]|uniref:DUF2607 family protein n=1 Tax=Methylophaga nitratireducenticrescens TaxID=754476 RepID=I1XHX7_METNJ|nr:hypothetical protein [Methylophaga nitratireducenticrescens]AFI83996.1 hypothetical protein Q7A_1158 [Methylophaga nitratireducenticrescens]